MRGPLRLRWVFVAAVCFGVGAAIVKGQDAGIRDVLGNTSAPWILPPFIAGMATRRSWHGAAAGALATSAAFAAFYVAEAFILDLGPHPWYVDLRLTAGTLNPYEKLGFVSGALYGALGYAWAARRSRWAPLAVGGAFVAEPLIVLMVVRTHVWGGGSLLAHPVIWVTEMAVGVLLTVALLERRRRASAVR
ncbi:MAG: hypothetical protein QOC55_2028 [Thermoleophilaceae bacterium]|nr:hypothetical protein [Thermoleophilaceae bacterium]